VERSATHQIRMTFDLVMMGSGCRLHPSYIALYGNRFSSAFIGGSKRF
jgi:hypothetical protein